MRWREHCSKWMYKHFENCKHSLHNGEWLWYFWLLLFWFVYANTHAHARTHASTHFIRFICHFTMTSKSLSLCFRIWAHLLIHSATFSLQPMPNIKCTNKYVCINNSSENERQTVRSNSYTATLMCTIFGYFFWLCRFLKWNAIEMSICIHTVLFVNIMCSLWIMHNIHTRYTHTHTRTHHMNHN